MNYKISIITINLNNAEGLRKTIGSVLNQRYTDFEFIIVDGNSNDGSKEIINQHSDKIAKVISESDSGIYNAMNKGIKISSGKYLLFLNSGDELTDKDSLLSVADYLTDEGIIYGNLLIRNKEKDYIAYYPDKLSIDFILKESLPHPATFIKKTVFDKVGLYNENLKICSDWEFFIKAICKFNISYRHIDKTFSIFYFDGISSVEQNMKQIEEERNIVIKNDFSYYISIVDELKEARELKSHIKNSRLLRLIRKLGLLKHLYSKDQ